MDAAALVEAMHRWRRGHSPYQRVQAENIPLCSGFSPEPPTEPPQAAETADNKPRGVFPDPGPDEGADPDPDPAEPMLVYRYSKTLRRFLLQLYNEGWISQPPPRPARQVALEQYRRGLTSQLPPPTTCPPPPTISTLYQGNARIRRLLLELYQRRWISTRPPGYYPFAAGHVTLEDWEDHPEPAPPPRKFGVSLVNGHRWVGAERWARGMYAGAADASDGEWTLPEEARL